MQLNSESVGRTIKRIRKQRGMTQELLSGLAGIARSHLAMIENNTKQPNLETIWRIAIALELAPSELIHEIEKENMRQ